MTFYGVISAILFLGACRQVIVAIDHSNWGQFAMAITLAIFVFNDAIFTSYHIERAEEPVVYQLPLKLIDLFNFLFLVAALVVVNPEDNVFLTGAKHLPDLCAEWQFWALLAIYWLLINVWTSLAKVYQKNKYPRWLRSLSIGIILLLILTALSSATLAGLGQIMRWITLLYTFLYIVIVRPVALRKVSSPATVNHV